VNLAGLLPLLQSAPAYRRLIASMGEEAPEATASIRSIEVLGVIQPARPYLVAALSRHALTWSRPCTSN
jgi:hypothetical protein